MSPTSIFERSGFVFVFGRFSDIIRRKTIIDSITVTVNDIRSPESHGIRRLIISRVAVANAGSIILRI